METWSDLPVRDTFRVKFYLDTNILAYLVDKTYLGLTQAINYLKDSEFVDLVSSKYVIFEFVGIRKREHYLQKVLDRSASNSGGRINLSSLLKYKDGFDSEVKFEDVQVDIKNIVENELETITSSFGINFLGNVLHDSLLNPTFDINLSSKISKEDSLVLASAIWSDIATKEPFVIIASNDDQFVKSYCAADLSQMFSKYSLKPPIVEHLRNIKLVDETKINLTDSNDNVHISTFLPNKLKELLLLKNKTLFLGSTFTPTGVSFPEDAVCFKLQPNTAINTGIYLTFIGKDLDFIYSTKVPILNFFNNGPISSYPFSSPLESNISFTPKDNSTGSLLSLDTSIVSRLREQGNFLFINPD